MDRGHKAISGWPALLLAPITIPLAIIAGLLENFGWVRRVKSNEFDLRPEEVAEYLRDFIEGTGGAWDWDHFEHMRLENPELEAIRKEAVMAGPPNADINKLQDCLARAESLRAQARVQALTHQPG